MLKSLQLRVPMKTLILIYLLFFAFLNGASAEAPVAKAAFKLEPTISNSKLADQLAPIRALYREHNLDFVEPGPLVEAAIAGQVTNNFILFHYSQRQYVPWTSAFLITDQPLSTELSAKIKPNVILEPLRFSMLKALTKNQYLTAKGDKPRVQKAPYLGRISGTLDSGIFYIFDAETKQLFVTQQDAVAQSMRIDLDVYLFMRDYKGRETERVAAQVTLSTYLRLYTNEKILASLAPANRPKLNPTGYELLPFELEKKIVPQTDQIFAP